MHLILFTYIFIYALITKNIVIKQPLPNNKLKGMTYFVKNAESVYDR